MAKWHQLINARYRQNLLFYQPHEKQKLFHDAGAEVFRRLFLGGNRTGKTYSSSVEISMHLTGNYPDWWAGYRYEKPIDVWVAGESNAETYQILQGYYIGNANKEGLIHPNLIVYENKMYHIFGIRHTSGGVSTLRFKSYEQGRRKFQGAKVDIVHLDEEPSIDILNECSMRLMSTDKTDQRKMLILSMTPLLGMSNVVKSFIDNAHEREIKNNSFYVQVGWQDVNHLTEDDKETRRSQISPHEIEAREKGIPLIGSGLVYPVNLDAMLIAPFNIPPQFVKLCALDFGWTNPTAALIGYYDDNNDILYITGEYYVSERTPDQHVYNLCSGQISKDTVCVYDPAGQSSSQADGKNLVKMYQEAGLTNMHAADNNVESGILTVLQRMQNGKLKIFNHLHNFASEFRSYARNSGKIIKRNDHLMDCLRYLIVSGIKFARMKSIRRNMEDQYDYTIRRIL